MTEAEKILWGRLRNNKIGYRFVRQFSVKGYVIDFYCPRKRFGIELEGKIHLKTDVRKYDDYRRKYLEAFGINIITLENNEIEYELEKVIRIILYKLTP